MDILMKVRILRSTSIGGESTRHDTDAVINLSNMMTCGPTGKEKEYTLVNFTNGNSVPIEIRHEDFITLLKKLYGGKFIEVEDYGAKKA